MVASGDVIAQRYELGGQLGRGGMSIVYQATDRLLGRDVAVKILSPHLADDPDVVDRFRNEARAAARLNHPNVVAVYDSGSEDGLHYIVMELVVGPTLADALDDVGRFTPDRAVETAIEVAKALEAAHDQNLIHRDVKPGNVLWADTGRVKVSDFGIARITETTTVDVADIGFGSIPYIAPEQARDEPTDHRVDLYALGCVLYEMLTGTPPFQAEMPMAVLHQHANVPPDPPSSRVPGLPDELDAIVLRALEKDPDDRYPNATMMRRDLEHVLGTLPAAADDADTTHLMPPVDPTVAVGTVASGRDHAEPPPDDEGRSTARTVGLVLAVIVLLIVAAIGLGTFLGLRVGGDGDGSGFPETQTLRVGG